jgi:phage terminase large subunit-like protein
VAQLITAATVCALSSLPYLCRLLSKLPQSTAATRHHHTDDSIQFVDPSFDTVIPEAAHIEGVTMVDTPEGTLVTIDNPALAHQNINAAAAAADLSGPAIDNVRLRPRPGPGNGNSATAAGSSSSVALLLAAVVALVAVLGL